MGFYFRFQRARKEFLSRRKSPKEAPGPAPLSSPPASDTAGKGKPVIQVCEQIALRFFVKSSDERCHM